MGSKKRNDDSTTDSLQSVSKGAALYFLGKPFSDAIGFIFHIVLTRTLGAGLYGVYTYADTIIGFFIIFARLGTGKSVLRFLPSSYDDPEYRNWIVSISYLTSLSVSLLIGMMIFIFAPLINSYTLNENTLIDVLRIMSILLPFNTVLNLTTSIFRASEHVSYQIGVENFLYPLVRLLAVITAFAIGYSLIGAVAGLTIGVILTLSISLTLLYKKTDISPSLDYTNANYFEFYNYSIPLTFRDLGSKVWNRADLLMVGFFLTGASVGIYQVSILLTSLLTLPLVGMNQIFPPIVSKLISMDRKEELQDIYSIVTRWISTLVILPFLFLCIFSENILLLFGDEFTDGALVLVVLAIAQATNSLSGPSSYLLMMTGHQYITLLNEWLLAIVNISLNYILIQYYGILGAAIATSSTLLIINIVRVIQIYHLEDLNPYSIRYYKPFLSGAFSLFTIIFIDSIIGGYASVLISLPISVLVFFSSIYLLGIEKEDKEFYSQTIEPKIPI